jgi:DNA invertase Pin-like site-specific DNA recombinase
VTLALDRLGRKTRLVLDLVEELTSYNVALVSCKEALDATTATGKLCLTLFAGLSQLERDQVSERTTAALGELARQTGYKGALIPAETDTSLFAPETG